MKNKFTTLPNFKKSFKIITKYNKKIKTYKEKIEKMTNEIEVAEKDLSKIKLNIYAASNRLEDKNQLDIIHIKGYCEVDGKEGFIYDTIYHYSTMDKIDIERDNRWVISSVDKFYEPITKIQAKKMINNHLNSLRDFKTLIADFIGE